MKSPQKFFSDPKMNRKVYDQAKIPRPRPVVKKLPTATTSSSCPQKRRKLDPDSLFNNFSNKRDKVNGNGKGKGKSKDTESDDSSSSEVEVVDGYIKKKKKKVKPVAQKGGGVKRRTIRPPSDTEDDSDKVSRKVDRKGRGRAKGDDS